MTVATKVSVRTDGEGVLSMNFMIEVEGKNVFVEFRVFPYPILKLRLGCCECGGWRQ
jgi:hypothetical protein